MLFCLFVCLLLVVVGGEGEGVEKVSSEDPIVYSKG